MERKMRLSNRLETVASFVAKGSIVADVGTDHGYIPICLVEREISPAAIGMDVRKGPLERAVEHILEHGLEKVIDVRLGDGLEKLEPGEADTVVIAGMGGELIIHILDGGRRLWDSVRDWILSPQSDLEKVRLFLWENGFEAEAEAMVEEDGKYYTVMKCRRSLAPRSVPALSLLEQRYGRMLLQEGSPVLRAYLEQEIRQLCAVRERLLASGTEKARKRLKEVEEELNTAKEAYDEVQRNYQDS